MQESMSLEYMHMAPPKHQVKSLEQRQENTFFFFFFFFSLVTDPRRFLSLELSDARVYEPQPRARFECGFRGWNLAWFRASLSAEVVSDFGFRISDFGFRGSGVGFGVWNSGFGDTGFGFRVSVSSFGFRC